MIVNSCYGSFPPFPSHLRSAELSPPNCLDDWRVTPEGCASWNWVCYSNTCRQIDTNIQIYSRIYGFGILTKTCFTDRSVKSCRLHQCHHSWALSPPSTPQPLCAVPAGETAGAWFSSVCHQGHLAAQTHRTTSNKKVKRCRDFLNLS